jgi:hypothetical protein
LRESDGTLKMIVIGCGKAKRDEPAKAMDLYTGSLFRLSRRYAEASRRPWVILSGAHGIVQPHEILMPYDAGPPDKGRERQAWAWAAAEKIAAELARLGLGKLGVELCAGVAYAAPVARELDRLGVRAVQPLAGMGVGERLRQLKLWTNELVTRA